MSRNTLATLPVPEPPAVPEVPESERTAELALIAWWQSRVELCSTHGIDRNERCRRCRKMSRLEASRLHELELLAQLLASRALRSPRPN